MKKNEKLKLMTDDPLTRKAMAEDADDQRAVADPDLSQAEEVVIKNYLRFNMNAGGAVLPLRRFIQDLETKLIAYTLLIHMGNQKKVASLLGIKPSTLCEKLQRTRFDKFVLRFNNLSNQSAEFIIDFNQDVS